MPKIRLLSLCSRFRSCMAGGLAGAQDAYPSKPVRVIVPFACGPADLIARLIGQKLSEDFGKQFYIENHAGAGGNLGNGIAARAPADGYTLMINSQALVIKPASTSRCPTIPTRTWWPSPASPKRPT